MRRGSLARPLRRILLALIGVLYVVSIPWYREAGADASLWLGLPDWVTVALLCYAAVAVLNAIAWLLTDVPDVDVREAPGHAAEARAEDGRG